MNKIVESICKFIPRYVSNRVLVYAIDIMSLFGRFGFVYKLSHEEFNKQSDIATGYIDNQHAYSDMFIGKSTVDLAGCEAIACFNVFISMRKYDYKLSDIIARFERRGIVNQGRFGVSPLEIVRFFRSMGYRTDKYILTGKKCDIQTLPDNHKAYIMVYYNNGDDLMEQIHTIAIIRDGNTFQAHNVYCNGCAIKGCSSIEEVVANIGHGKARPIMFIGIDDAREINR